ncbi:hypothetical protein H2198_000894 [Neophaeococcomyces mojaviensis]|uniref:Uncharacterized protein n=1 Tax=Neophaeococcomyces mojaviensis TaxID=3383035 RepID=A0ACC3AJ80_9EURO|nr:hypothetical protein H2198_000894 [Knufia sp. JES_112]
MDGEGTTKAEQDDTTGIQETTIEQSKDELYLVPNEVGMRGGGCIPSALCDKLETHEGSLGQEESVEERVEEQATAWKGWAEIENDPEIFTILVQEWGASNIHVEEVLDITELSAQNPSDVLGLIFLSRYLAPDTTHPSTPSITQDLPTAQPWFANQISKFSCGTVSLMNILMNSEGFQLSEILSSFKEKTKDLPAKGRGVFLDEHETFRDIHNSFSTLLDRMIVDQILKEEVQAAARRSQTPKRKKGKKGRKRRAISVDNDEMGNHFVAYIPAHAKVWRLDGMEIKPRCIGEIVDGTTWLHVASAALAQPIEDAMNADYDVSLMKVTKNNMTLSQQEAARLEKERKQEDWAPFVEHMLRLHAEKGDLAQKLPL